MDYFEYLFETSDQEQGEIIMAETAEVGFDSFEQDDEQVSCYISETMHKQYETEISQLVEQMGIPYSTRRIKAQNWNALWESNFESIDVDGRCMIRAPFHPQVDGYDYTITIMPKMSFGTGHHATTHLVVQGMLDAGVDQFRGLKGLDMGSGTGVLAILAVKMGATDVDAVDIDEWAYENCQENISQNGVETHIKPILGDVSAIEGCSYDFILANINRNILLNDMSAYAATLKTNGVIFLSGILECDIDTITSCCNNNGITITHQKERNGWVMLRGKKD